MQQHDSRVADLVQAGEIRVGLFLPQYALDAASGDLKGVGTGFLAIELTQIIATRLGIGARVIQYPAPNAAIVGLKNNTCDVVFLGIAPSRATEVDFAPAIFQFDYSLLLPPGSSIASVADADRKGIRIGIVEGHASAMALLSIVKNAQLVGAELPEETFDLLKQGKIDALAFPRDHVLDFASKLPNSRVLAKGYGINRVGIAIRKGCPGLLAYCSEFSKEVLDSGTVQSIIHRESLPGFEAATAGDPT
jgi:polar amino acid transport system substrate-binding protein